MTRFLLGLFFSLLFLNAMAAEVDSTSNKTTALKISGGLGASITFYGVDGIEPQRPPSFWNLRGSININIYNQVNIPFSFNFSQQNSNYTHPFNQFGIAPHYKSITLYLGYNSLNFSEYSVNGINFLGAGVDINPNNSWVRGKALIGRFIKSVPYSNESTLFISNPAYERWGYGLMIEVGKKKNNIGLIAFKAQDIPSSINGIPSDFQLNPAENIIFGLTTYQRITSKISFKGELDHSAYTRNINEDPISVNSYSYANHLGSLFQPRLSTTFNYALKGDLDYSFKKIMVGIGYKRLGPDYQSMGTVFLENNKEEYLLKIRGMALKNKFTYMANGGLQRSNLDNHNLSTNLRFIGAINLSYTFTPSFNVGLSYSNFNTSNQIQQISHADSVRYVQTTNNIGISSNYNFKTENKTHAIILIANYSKAYTLYKTSTFQYVLPDTVIEVTGSEKETENGFFNSNLGYNLGFTKWAAFTNLSLNYSDMRNENFVSQTIGPIITIGKSMFDKKLRLSLSVSYLNTLMDYKTSGDIINNRLMISYRLYKKHSFRLFILNVNRKFTDNSRKSYSEYRGGIEYRYRF